MNATIILSAVMLMPVKVSTISAFYSSAIHAYGKVPTEYQYILQKRGM